MCTIRTVVTPPFCATTRSVTGSEPCHPAASHGLATQLPAWWRLKSGSVGHGNSAIFSYVKPSTCSTSCTSSLSTASTACSRSSPSPPPPSPSPPLPSRSTPSSAGSMLMWPTTGRRGTYGVVEPSSSWQWPANANVDDAMGRAVTKTSTSVDGEPASSIARGTSTAPPKPHGSLATLSAPSTGVRIRSAAPNHAATAGRSTSVTRRRFSSVMTSTAEHR